jgi:uncharacterized coiled-coil DUF342 family protein
MSAKDEYVAQMKAKIDEWNAEIDELEAKARKSEAKVRQRYMEQVAALKAKRDDASRRIQDIQSASGDAWENLKGGVEKVSADIANTLKETKTAFLEGLRGR